MTTEMKLVEMSLDHMTRQPSGLRYALFCDGVSGVDNCESVKRLGHLGDFSSYDAAKEKGLIHPHGVVIKFYPDEKNRKPSEGFINDFDRQKDG